MISQWAPSSRPPRYPQRREPAPVAQAPEDRYHPTSKGCGRGISRHPHRIQVRLMTHLCRGSLPDLVPPIGYIQVNDEIFETICCVLY